MCGIAGFFAPDVSSDEGRHRLDHMLRAIAHRGPDGQGAWFNSELGLYLGMRRLSIIDIDGGQQPIWNEDHTIAIVFNGEIYNYIELRAELEAAGHVFSTHTDTEVLVHLYERDGESLFASLRGMFALAIFDSRQHRLLVARDLTGQKPFFYYSDTRHFAFASEIKSLLMLPFVPDEIDSSRFLDYLAWGSLPAPVTHFKHIRKLPPASFLSIDLNRPGDLTVRSFDYRPDDAPLPALSDPDAAATALDTALKDSARLHLRADVPVGVLLSSGMDSQTVAAYTQEIHPEQICSFTATFHGPESEQAGAETSARMVKSNHFNITLTAHDFLEHLPETAWHLDEPVVDPAAFAVNKVCQFARSHVKVLLGGEGSDELFAGYTGRYRGILGKLERSTRIRQWAGWLPDIIPYRTTNSLGRLIQRAHMTEAEEIVQLRAEGFPGNIRCPLYLTPDHQKRINESVSHYAQIVYKEKSSPLETLLHFDRAWQLPESLLVKADRMSMAASIELRSPFLDAEILKLADRMTMGLKLPTEGGGKWILFKCLQRRFPDLVRREKQGFPIPLTAWLNGPLRSQIEDALFGPLSTLSSLVDPARLRSAWNAFLAGRCPATFFYALWLYEVWRHEFPRRIETLKAGT